MFFKRPLLRKIMTLGWLAVLSTGPGAQPLFGETSMTSLLPEVSGWQHDGQPAFYVPENLFEYIDGAAENFLAYDFQELAIQNYKNAAGAALTIEMYRHRDANAAFGIYSSEKPLAGNYLSIGAQGYSEEEILNFFSGSYYVKISGFELGNEKTKILEGVARSIAERIPDAGGMPSLLEAFPEQGKVKNSERFILKNFLGQPFLHSAFVADYAVEGRQFQVFIITAGSPAAVSSLLSQYKSMAGIAGPTAAAGRILIPDPYNGPVPLAWKESTVWGIATVNRETPAVAEDYLNLVGDRLFPAAVKR